MTYNLRTVCKFILFFSALAYGYSQSLPRIFYTDHTGGPKTCSFSSAITSAEKSYCDGSSEIGTLVVSGVSR
jgi:hypothetical protein